MASNLVTVTFHHIDEPRLYVRRPPTLIILGMGGAGGVVGDLHPITLLPLRMVIRKDEGVHGRGVITSEVLGAPNLGPLR